MGLFPNPSDDTGVRTKGLGYDVAHVMARCSGQEVAGSIVVPPQEHACCVGVPPQWSGGARGSGRTCHWAVTLSMHASDGPNRAPDEVLFW